MASSNNRLYRNFVILQEDERGYASSNDKTLSGYSKIEAKGDNCKISFYVQNLRKDDEKYCMMLICCKKDMKQIINLGPIAISELGKGEAIKEYITSNIGGLGIAFDKVSGAAIAKMSQGNPIYIMCGFLNGEQPTDNWKNYKVVKCVDGKEKVGEKEFKKEQKKDEKKEHKHLEKKHEECKTEEKKAEENKEVIKTKESKSVEITIEEKNNSYVPKENLRGKFDDYEDEIEANKEFDPSTSKIRGSIGEYFESIVEGFERHDKGFDELKYTKWYKVPIHDLYEMCNMANYNKYTLAYYPMLNYYPYIKKHGYFMLGYKCDSKGNLMHIIYGVPGTKDRDDQPYDGKTGFVTWMKLSDNDEVGCWLMFYDFKNSTVVVPMK